MAQSSTTTSTSIPISALSEDLRITLGTDLASIKKCQLQTKNDRPEKISVGFPRPVSPEVFRSTRILLIPVSMADFAFSAEDLSYAEDAVAKALEFWTAVSYDQADLTSTVLPQEHWPKLQESSTELGFPAGRDTTDFSEFANNILDRVQLSYDYSEYDILLIALPVQPPFQVAQIIELREPAISGNGFEQTASLIGSVYLALWEIVAHELGHSWLRLEDLYNYDSLEKYMGEWDIMGGHISAGNELTAWNRWLAGWITDNQIRCIDTANTSIHFIEAIEIGSDFPKAAVVRVSEDVVVVVESRRNLGFDKGGSVTVVYTVDSSKYPMEGVFRLQAELTNVGQSATVEGVSISLLETDATGDLVQVNEVM